MIDFCLILTATINPGEMPDLVRKDSNVRLSDYKKSFRFWLEKSTVKKIIFIDNSNSDLTFFKNLASEYNNNKIKLNKDTPIFSVIDEVSVPNQRSEPKRGQIVIIYVFLGLVLSVGFILGKSPLMNLIKEIKD